MFSSGFCTSFVEMAASCCSSAVFPISRPDLPCAVIWSNSVSQPQQSYRFGLSVLAPKRLQVRKSVLASSRGDNETGVVTHKSWDKLIKDSDTPVLVEFYASWCGPCRMVHRIIEEISAEYSDQLKCFILDADDDSQVAEEYDVKAVPVVMLFKNGEKRESVAGTMPKEFYVSAIERVLAS